MFNYIKGKKEYLADNKLVLEVGGIGYELFVSTACEQEIKDKSEVKVYTYMAVREDDVSLFGFYSIPEKEMFLQLISVSGIGPKVALAILSGISVDKLAANIISQDTNALNKIKGVGKKTAARIVLELKDKITKDYDSSTDEKIATIIEDEIELNEDAIKALMTFGYNKKEASAMVAKVSKEGMSVEDVIYNALKNA